MHDALKAAIKKLGGKLGRKPDSAKEFMAGLAFYSSERDESWEGKDPLGQLKDVSETIRSFDAVKWPAGNVFIDHDHMEEWTEVELVGASENYEVGVGKKRRLLYQIGWEPILQYIYAVDLFDKATDPAVYRFDHGDPGDVSDPNIRRLSLFLGSLATKKALSTYKRRTEWDDLIEAATSAKDYKKAIALSERAIEQHAAESIFRVNLADYYAEAGQKKKAAAIYEQVLELEPDEDHALSNYVNDLVRQGQLDKAEGLLDRALESDSDLVVAHLNLAWVYGLRGQKAKMLEAIKRTTTLDKSKRREILEDPDFAQFRNDRNFLALLKAKPRKSRK